MCWLLSIIKVNKCRLEDGLHFPRFHASATAPYTFNAS